MAFEKTQEKLDELRNLTWQNGKLIEQVETLTNMLEEKEDSALVVEIKEAKKDIADAINTKGGNSTPDESFQQLARDIQLLPNSGISAGGIVQDAPFRLLNALFNQFTNITEIYEEEELIIDGKIISVQMNGAPKILFPNLRSITLLKTNYFIFDQTMIPNCVNFILPSTTVYYTYSFTHAENIETGKLESASNPFYGKNKILRNFTIGQDTDVDLPFQDWTATNIIATGQSGIDELNSNLYNNLLAKLYDHSNDGETRVLRIGWLAHVTQENIDYANSKGWTLTT